MINALSITLVPLYLLRDILFTRYVRPEMIKYSCKIMANG